MARKLSKRRREQLRQAQQTWRDKRKAFVKRAEAMERALRERGIEIADDGDRLTSKR